MIHDSFETNLKLKKKLKIKKESDINCNPRIVIHSQFYNPELRLHIYVKLKQIISNPLHTDVDPSLSPKASVLFKINCTAAAP